MSKGVNGQRIIELFEQFSPKNLAVEGDKIGLQIGTLNKKVNRVLVALDVVDEVIDEAIANDVQLIIAHHPPIFRPLKDIRTDQAQGKLLEKCIKNDIAIYVAHTNLDVAKGGVNDLLAEALQLKDTEVLVHTYEQSLKKLVVFVPKTHDEVVRKALGDAGAGHIGAYSHCSYTSNGTGAFFPKEGANPFMGQIGKIEEVEEMRIETIISSDDEQKIIKKMLQAHPYEEVAYDLYELNNQGETLGLGRVGKLEVEMSLQEFAEIVKEKLQVPAVRVVGDETATVKKVAVLGGDGNKYIYQAKRKGVDVYITGDIYYHVAHDAMMLGLNIIDPGHNIEKIMKKGVVDKMEQMMKDEKLQVDWLTSKVETEPFTFK
ncbi:Nif3-like dinuclear metal center hexameric protein [Bacillus carboniphilus]|uniref:GTP cyclohydrolase 1 type 2 homolog n=1 Tax=Bacillus carboniphilus TaxID=86663 RepID=A0ABY9K2C0_9BACI|nr:Nif3-like dinuclear metal center hexameric protein [Bacillus carboniphilus]WLR43970.1 Nif3-like dinuclear metal center hexameric protein [Bacillus carboniphilus]